MALATGSRLGPYEISSALGAGGMGEVYRARDTKLGRDVAVKVLPEAFARDGQRMARFQREAKTLAALNHANIASIYGLEDSGNSQALVMELVEGPTLADRIGAGPIALDEALPIARQICEALEYAHERGIVHRDLKPANIKVSRDDSVKILDFGLAKAIQGEAEEDLANSPTLSHMATQAGVLLGTAAYMSPEQAKAKPVDRRADIWAFGCVLYQMLTGKMAFHGETITETLAAIMRAEPDWSKLPSATPTRIRVLLQRCLQKDPKQRLRDIGDARISIDEVLAGAPEGAPGPAAALPTWRRTLPWALASVLAIALATLAFAYLRAKRVVPPAPLRFQIAPPENALVDPVIGLSPDGRSLAFTLRTAGAKPELWVHFLDSGESRLLTEGTLPFWSPDSRFVGYEDDGKLMKIEATGGPPETLADLPDIHSYGLGAWSQDGVIVFGTPTGLYRVSASGGVPVQITAADPSRQENYHDCPSFLPDGRHLLYTRFTRLGNQGIGFYLASIDAKPEQQSTKLLIASPLCGAYAPSADPDTGYLLYMRESTLMAQPFDNRRMELDGQPTSVVQPVADEGGVGAFSASSPNTLVYMPKTSNLQNKYSSQDSIEGQLTWFNRDGKVLGTFGDPGVYRTLAISPNGKSVAFELADSKNVRNLWIYDLSRGVATRFTFDANWDTTPIWSPDGRRIAFGSYLDMYMDLYQKASNLTGENEVLFKSNYHKVPSSWSPDGRFLLYYTPEGPNQIWVLPVGGDGADRKPVRFDDSKFNEVWGRFSPDGRWIAYTSDESGRDEVYVQPFDAASVAGSPSTGSHLTGKWLVSNHGGNSSLWQPDGKELFYISPDGMAMEVDVNTKGVFQAGVPKPMFKVPVGIHYWDVSPDGKRFLLPVPSAESAPARQSFNVVLNWQTALKQ